MATARTQENRPISITTSLGADGLILRSMNGTEALGRLFHFELDLVAEKPVNAGDVLGKNVTIQVLMADDKIRFFNGYISRFAFHSVDRPNKDQGMLYYYRATIVPWTWFLTRKADCRIFQNKSVRDIIKEIFNDAGFSDFKDQTTGTYDPRIYCVQYRESDFNFISRLMEKEGIYYFFEHENGKHSLVLCDSRTAHKAAPGYAELYFDKPDLKSADDTFIWDWTLGTEITSNKYAHTDYNPLQPKTDLKGYQKLEHTHDPGEYEVFDYPGEYEETSDATRYAKVRLQEIETQYATACGESCAKGIFPGCTFTLKGHPVCDPEEFLITSVTYQLENDDIGLGTGKTSEREDFLAHVTCMPHKYEFRSPRTTRKPVVQGPQPAVVVGPSGEEIHSDEHGRVKVKFFWDRDPAKNETSSCWVRVSQPSAGMGWGAINLPRIGQEVIVDFLEGDPDRPIITGRVYNGVNAPPYALPGNQTMTTFKSNSSKGGEGFNELRFEDKKGEEQIFVHGEKNLDIRVKNDRFETIGHDRNLVVENDKLEHVKKNRHEIVDVDHIETIKNDRNLTVKGKEAKQVDKTVSLKVTGAVTEEFADNHSEKVTKDYFLQADNIVIQALTNLTIKVGKNFIVFESSGIKIGCEESGAKLETKSAGDTKLESQANVNVKSSTDTKIEAGANGDFKAGANATLKGGAQVEVSGPMATLKGDSMTTVKGGMVKIN